MTIDEGSQDASDDLHRAAATLERPLEVVVGDYEEPEGGLGESRARGIYLLPNVITTGALFAGFYAIVAGMQGDFYAASVAVFVAMVFDGLDGRVARLTNTSSAFGAEYDSLADMVSFGVAPALLTLNWALTDLGKSGWVAAFIYTACAALRLARFNTRKTQDDERFFTGLPSPAAAALAAGSVWLGQHFAIDARFLPIATAHALVLVCLGFLMMSNFRYYSFKRINVEGRVPFVRVLLVLFILGLVALNPPVLFWCAFIGYALSGPMQHLRGAVVEVGPTNTFTDQDDKNVD